MCLRSFFLLMLSLFFISTSWSQNLNRSKDNFDLARKQNFNVNTFNVTFSDSWLGKDKADHFLVSAFLAAGSFYLLNEENKISSPKSIYLSTGLSFSIGIAKEIRDGLTPGKAASIKDLFADILGIGLGILLWN